MCKSEVGSHTVCVRARRTGYLLWLRVYYNMHIASQEYSIFFTDYYNVILSTCSTIASKSHYNNQ